ncbi:unnamed protein product [Arabidopsis lyrata]|uniref:Predicted protein n=1 Tax=Arabidopsis lyrata subsp. lyrata TaxID=81972 RepID=D7MRW8_ARALL|nr:predicted protein [Arabidopsis lyrata subsp. lyrata]CAH8280817.1 unnamed protein product [Arabidopsis lyrata]
MTSRNLRLFNRRFFDRSPQRLRAFLNPISVICLFGFGLHESVTTKSYFFVYDVFAGLVKDCPGVRKDLRIPEEMQLSAQTTRNIRG